MKTFAAFAILTAVFCFAAAFVGPTHATKETCCFSTVERGGDNVRVKRITAEEIRVSSGDGKSSLLIRSAESGVGMWLTRGEETLCMVADDSHTAGGPYVGVISAKDPVRGCKFAMCIGRDGKAYLQVVGSSGDPVILMPDEILKAIGK